MSRIIYIGSSTGRVKLISKSVSVVPAMIGGSLAVKWTKIMALAPMVKFPILTLCGFQCVIPFAFYIMARRYVYQLAVFNEYTEEEYYEIQSLSPLMWTTSTTKFTARDVAWPDQPEALSSFLVQKKRFLWDQHNVSHDDYQHLTRFATGIDFENLDQSLEKKKKLHQMLKDRENREKRQQNGS